MDVVNFRNRLEHRRVLEVNPLVDLSIEFCLQQSFDLLGRETSQTPEQIVRNSALQRIGKVILHDSGPDPIRVSPPASAFLDSLLEYSWFDFPDLYFLPEDLPRDELLHVDPLLLQTLPEPRVLLLNGRRTAQKRQLARPYHTQEIRPRTDRRQTHSTCHLQTPKLKIRKESPFFLILLFVLVQKYGLVPE